MADAIKVTYLKRDAPEGGYYLAATDDSTYIHPADYALTRAQNEREAARGLCSYNQVDCALIRGMYDGDAYFVPVPLGVS